METYLTSDLHFCHRNICKFTDRKDFTTQEQHDDWLVNIWNSQVDKGSKVFHLGDFSFSHNKEEVLALVKKLKGQKFFIKGNHDRSDILDYLKENNAIQNWFDYKEIKIGDNHTCLFHFPISSWHKQHYGAWHLHGHCVDNFTEILTTEGFKKFGDFAEGDMIYSYNKYSKQVESKPIDLIISKQYTGKVYELDNKSVNFRVTFGHTIVGENRKREFIEKPVESLTNCTRTKLITSAFKSEETSTGLKPDELKLYICIVADGSIKRETNLCRIRVKKVHKIRYLRNLFSNLSLEVKEYASKNYISFNFYIPASIQYWNFKGLDVKLLRANKEEVKYIIDAYRNSDGHAQGVENVIIYSQKEKEIDLLQSLFCVNGRMSTKYSRFHGFGDKLQYQLSVTNNQFVGFRGDQLKESEVTDEHFWCIKTANQNFFIRRNGRISLTGNCHGQYEGSGKILDVGLDSAYKIFGEHRFFTEQDIEQIMQNKEIQIADNHRKDKSID